MIGLPSTLPFQGAPLQGVTNMTALGSAFAVVSLAIQLVGTVKEVHDFLCSVQNAPQELTRLVDSLDSLHAMLNCVRDQVEQHFLVLRLPGSPLLIVRALENCERKVKGLENLVNSFRESRRRQRRVVRLWVSMRVVMKRNYLLDIQSQLRDAEARLQTAIMSNTWQLQ